MLARAAETGQSKDFSESVILCTLSAFLPDLHQASMCSFGNNAEFVFFGDCKVAEHTGGLLKQFGSMTRSEEDGQDNLPITAG
jgi:hypothetical protein